MDKLGQTFIDDYRPREISIDCLRCRRHAHVSTATLKKKFGNQRLDVIARMVARSSAGGPRMEVCGLAEDPFQPLCSAADRG